MMARIFWLLTLASMAGFAEDAAAPPEVDSALRARVDKFYQAHITGKFKEAFLLVADDSQDTYLGSGNNRYQTCETLKITYSDNFSKAEVTEKCKVEYRWHGQTVPVTVPLPTHWKLESGQWFWYYVRPTEIMTPWGMSKIPPEGAETAGAIPADPLAMARDILKQVKIDKTEVRLKSAEASRDEVTISNGMPGGIGVSIEYLGQPGLTIKPEKAQLSAGEKTKVIFKYDPEDAMVSCGECAKRIKSTLTAQIRIEPTGQKFLVTVIFGVPPEMEKLLPKQ